MADSATNKDGADPPLDSQPPGDPQSEPQSAEAPTDRRGFVLWTVLAVIAGGIVSMGPVAAGLITFLDPLFRRKSAGGGEGEGPGEWMRITTFDALPETGEPVRFPVLADKTDAWNRTADQPVGAIYLRKIGKQVLALNAICPHAGCFVNYSEAENVLLCPCHNSAFHADGKPQQHDADHSDHDDGEATFGGKTMYNGNANPSPRPMDVLEVDDDKLNNSGEVWVRFVNYYPAKHEQEPKP